MICIQVKDVLVNIILRQDSILQSDLNILKLVWIFFQVVLILFKLVCYFSKWFEYSSNWFEYSSQWFEYSSNWFEYSSMWLEYNWFEYSNIFHPVVCGLNILPSGLIILPSGLNVLPTGWIFFQLVWMSGSRFGKREYIAIIEDDYHNRRCFETTFTFVNKTVCK